MNALLIVELARESQTTAPIAQQATVSTIISSPSMAHAFPAVQTDGTPTRPTASNVYQHALSAQT
jgi:hypothetical protein